MAAEDKEEERLRSVALQNSQSILLARRRAEEALFKQSEWLRVTLASIGDAVISTDAEGRVTFMNGVAESLTGCLQAEALGRPLPDVFHILNEYTRQPVDNPVERVLRDGKVVGLANHTVLIAQDGTERTIDDRAAPIRDDKGQVVGVVLVFNDITGRKRAEEASAHLAAIVESSDDAIVSKDLQGTITSWNKGAEKLFGYTVAEAVGRPVTMLIPSQYIDEEPRILEKIRRGETIDHYETVRQRKDGSLVDISLTVSPIRDEAGNIIGASKIARDITDRQRAQEALRKSEERFAKAFESSPLALTITSLKSRRLLEVNEVFTRLSGYTREEAVGRTTLELGLWARASDREAELAMVSEHGHVRSIEYRFCMKDGTERIGLLSAEQIEIGGEPCALTVIEDITEKKRAEAEREQLLASEREARREAEEANRMKDEFLATVSHELRTPLNAILGWARLLSGGRLDDETTTRGLKSVEQNAKAQAQLIEDLLDVSRIISGKFRLKAQPLELAPVIEAAIDSVRPAAEAKGVRLQVVLDPDAGPVSGDAGRLQQVVWNLLSNAVKFTPKGGRVQVRLMRIDSHIKLEVSDTGQGITHDFLPYVFDRFRQADGSASRSHGGLGLGLAIVRHIVEMHGGSVAVDSLGKGQGATFAIRLPLIVTHRRASREERAHPRVDGEGGLHFQPSPTLVGVKVLIVDDEPESLLLLSTVLTQSGANVKTATSADEGFALVKEWRPDVIVSDIGMPGEDGYSFMNRVKAWAREAGTWIPAVALTAYARTEDRMKALASGYQIHVPKPVEPAELITVLVSLVERPASPWKPAP
ncbi:MAG TPA: PAS domain S-box protein [Blastocatellia bacterium]|jgi:PAS domain S-box-containing protein|nr:PAS domain S-box protein [Blastocatellia bacterium]